MKEFPASSLTRQTADLFEAATRAPVAITKHRKPRFVVMSMDRYERLSKGAAKQIAVETDDMPEDLGRLLDRGLDAALRDE